MSTKSAEAQYTLQTCYLLLGPIVYGSVVLVDCYIVYLLLVLLLQSIVKERFAKVNTSTLYIKHKHKTDFITLRNKNN